MAVYKTTVPYISNRGGKLKKFVTNGTSLAASQAAATAKAAIMVGGALQGSTASVFAAPTMGAGEAANAALVFRKGGINKTVIVQEMSTAYAAGGGNIAGSIDVNAGAVAAFAAAWGDDTGATGYVAISGRYL